MIASASGINVMLDCGVHMGFKDERRYPEFKAVSSTGRYTDVIHAVVISHFHLDHIGALPYFTEVLGYRGPIIMSHATRALAPLMLDDYLGIARQVPLLKKTRAECIQGKLWCV